MPITEHNKKSAPIVFKIMYEALFYGMMFIKETDQSYCTIYPLPSGAPPAKSTI